MPDFRCNSLRLLRISMVDAVYPCAMRMPDSCRAPSSFVRADSPMKKCSSAWQISPPSTLPGARILCTSPQTSASAPAIEATSLMRDGAPGSVAIATRSASMAVSSTKVLSGKRSSAGNARTSTPQRRSALQYAACCASARLTSGGPWPALVRPFEKLRAGGRTSACRNFQLISRRSSQKNQLYTRDALRTGSLSLEQRTQHPRGLFVYREALSQEVRGRLIMRSVRDGEDV